MKAYEILLKCRSPENRYKLAKICLKLNKLREAEKALLNHKHSSRRSSTNNPNFEKQVPNGAAGCYLLGVIYDKCSKYEQANN